MMAPKLAKSGGLSPIVSSVQETLNVIGVELHEFMIQQTTDSAPMRMSRFTVAPGCATEVDRHAVHEIWLVARGKADVCYDSQWFSTSAGDALYFSPWKPHHARNIGEDELQIFSLWWS